MATKVFASEFKGKPVLEIAIVDDEGTPIYDYPVVSFGVKKAEAILYHIDEIEDFVAKYGE